MPASAVDELGAVLDRVQDLVAGITSGHWAAATPCTEWDVGALVAHMSAGNRLFAAAVRGEQQPPTPAGTDEDPVSSFRNSCRDLLDAFGAPGALEALVHVPFGAVPGAVAVHLRSTEMLVHGWDLARATDQRLDVDEAIVARELAFTRGALGAIPPDRRPFGPPQQAPDGAPALDQLAALLGRPV